MTTLVGTQSDLNSLLKSLIELDFDAIEAYDAAIDRMKNLEYRSQLMQFRSDHARHVEELSRVLRDSGKEPPKGPDIKRVLTRGKVIAAGLVGDRAIIFAMKTNETDTNVAYERASSSSLVPAQVKDILRRNLADERRHAAWMKEILAGEEPPYSAPAGPSI
jgi:rubrerythrin